MKTLLVIIAVTELAELGLVLGWLYVGGNVWALRALILRPFTETEDQRAARLEAEHDEMVNEEEREEGERILREEEFDEFHR